MTVEKTVGEKIKQIREMKKVSVEELAARSGMEITIIQKIEQEKNKTNHLGDHGRPE